MESDVHSDRFLVASSCLPSKTSISSLQLINSLVMMHIMFIINAMPDYDMQAMFKTLVPA